MTNLIESIKCAVPRGFSRYYVMEVLKDGPPRTGKEIIEMAAEESGGGWRPSPGLIYPLLGRLRDEGMIAEVVDGNAGVKNTRYEITAKGARTTEDIRKIGEGLQRQVEVMARLGGAGRFVASDILERIASAAMAVAQSRGAGTIADTAAYRQFLKDELERLEVGEPGSEEGQDGVQEKGDHNCSDAVRISVK